MSACGVCRAPVRWEKQSRGRPVPFDAGLALSVHHCAIVTGTIRECACGAYVLEWEDCRPRANPDGTLHSHQELPSTAPRKETARVEDLPDDDPEPTVRTWSRPPFAKPAVPGNGARKVGETREMDD